MGFKQKSGLHLSFFLLYIHGHIDLRGNERVWKV